ncbi:hypothetical protein HHI36_017577, partial [Cryptolaemus montrouzieri]
QKPKLLVIMFLNDLYSNSYYIKAFVWVGFISFLMYILHQGYKKWRILKMVNKFDGPRSPSIIFGHMGILTQVSEKFCADIRSFSRKYYPHFGLRVIWDATVFILAPEDCQILMGSKKHSTKGTVYKVLENWLKDGLLLSSGRKWIGRRGILTPAFHFSILKDFVAIFNEESENLVKIISTNCSRPIDVVPLVCEFTLNSINETAMGTKINTEDNDQKAYRNAISTLLFLLRLRMMKPWLYSNWLYFFTFEGQAERRLLRMLHRFTRNVIRKRMDNTSDISEHQTQETGEDDIYMSKKKKRLAMLDILLQAKLDGEKINYAGICEEVDTFMFEGHDTTANALGFCLMLIANHTKIQEQIYQEIKTVLGDGDRKPTYNELQKMDLLERCIKESLRLYPSVPSISRIVEEDTTLNSGLVLPKGMNVNISIKDIHTNPEIYPDPEKFDPDRFLPDNSHNRHPYAYIPFSAGPRNCIGQKFAILEMKSVLIGILQHFRMTAVDTPQTIVLTADLILRSRDGIKVEFHERN